MLANQVTGFSEKSLSPSIWLPSFWEANSIPSRNRAVSRPLRKVCVSGRQQKAWGSVANYPIVFGSIAIRERNANRETASVRVNGVQMILCWYTDSKRANSPGQSIHKRKNARIAFKRMLERSVRKRTDMALDCASHSPTTFVISVRLRTEKKTERGYVAGGNCSEPQCSLILDTFVRTSMNPMGGSL